MMSRLSSDLSNKSPDRWGLLKAVLLSMTVHGLFLLVSNPPRIEEFLAFQRAQPQPLLVSVVQTCCAAEKSAPQRLDPTPRAPSHVKPTDTPNLDTAQGASYGQLNWLQEDLDGARAYRLQLARVLRQLRVSETLDLPPGLTGRVELMVTLIQGIKPSVKINQSSGSERLDQEGFRLLVQALEAPQLLTALIGQTVQILVPIEFGR